jgi:hypothetical protein
MSALTSVSCNSKDRLNLIGCETGNTKELVPALLASVEMHLRTTYAECFCQQGDARSIGSPLERGRRDAQP